MSSLTVCLKRIGAGKHEEAILRAMAADYVRDGYAAHEAAVNATKDYLRELEEERADILRQVKEAGGVVPGEEGAGGRVQGSGEEQKAGEGITVEQKGEDVEVKAALTKKEEAALTPKEQKKYLIKEIDAAIAAAPEMLPADELSDAEFAAFKAEEEASKTDSERAGVLERKNRRYMEIVGTVTIEVPGDGDFTILNSKLTLRDFKKKAASWPVAPTSQATPFRAASIRPTDKRISQEDVSYYNPFRPRKHGVVEKEEPFKGLDIKAHGSWDGSYFSNGAYLVKLAAKPETKKPMLEGERAYKTADIVKGAKAVKTRAAIVAELHQGQSLNVPLAHVVTENGAHLFLDAKLVDSVLTAHPEAEARADDEKGPVVFRVGKDVVGMVMPMQTDGVPEVAKRRYEAVTGEKSPWAEEEKAAEEAAAEEAPAEIAAGTPLPQEEEEVQGSGFRVQGEDQAPAVEGEAALAKARSERTSPKVGEEKITDAGEELKYNRRGRTGGGISWADVAELNPALQAREVVKAKVWPKEDYQALVEDDGVPVLAAHIVKQVYDALPAKPVVRGTPDAADLQRYIESVRLVQERVLAWAHDVDAIRETFQALTTQAGSMAGGYRGEKISLMDLTKASRSLFESIFPDYNRGDFYSNGGKYYVLVSTLGGNKFLKALQPGMESVKRATADIKAGWPGASESWQKQGYEVRPKEEAARISASYYDKAGNKAAAIEVGHYLVPGSIRPTQAEAEALLAGMKPFILTRKGRFVADYETQEAAVEAARATVKKAGPQISDARLAMADVRRTGPERRAEGYDITSQRLMEDFGFRGVNFGNWTNQKERQASLNAAYDALLDLADVLNVPPKALSLNGMLGLAFGAQGGGKFAAHFVPGLNEINLTKTRGAGTLAHEFAHALDHHFANQAGLSRRSDPYLSHNVGVDARSARTSPKGEGEVRPEIVEAFRRIREAMTRRPETEAEHKERMEEAKTRTLKNLNGWIKHVRVIFENNSTAADKAAALAEFDRMAERLRQGDLGEGYAQAGKIHLPQAVAELRDFAKKNAPAAAAVSDDWKAIGSWASTVAHMAAAKDAEEQHVPVKVGTSYYKEAIGLDKGKAKGYWARPTEMFARAFESYVIDRLEAEARRNDYLSYPIALPEAYPQGDERRQVNQAFDELVGDMQTRETEKGVELYDIEAPVWYSQMENVLAQKLPGSGTGEQMAQLVDGWARSGAFKLEELEWSGLKEWLSEQDGKVTKQQALDWLAANNVQVQEMVKGGRPFDGWTRDDLEKHYKDLTGAQPPAHMNDSALRAEITAIENEDEFSPKGDEEPVYQQYQLPGGENYRELLLTLPENQNAAHEARSARVKELIAQRDEYKKQWEKAKPGQEKQNLTRMIGNTSRQIDMVMAEKHDRTAFRSTHYQEPNILAHVRFNERYTSADGTSYTPPIKVLFIEEVQSDWHQKGRKEGYDTGKVDASKWVAEPNAIVGGKQTYVVKDENGNVRGNFSQYQIRGDETVSDLIQRVAGEEITARGVPNAPFKTAWPMLAMKRMVRWAAENGFDRLAWTTGEQQAERYDLSKKVESIAWSKHDKTAKLVSIAPHGANVIEMRVLPDGAVTGIGGSIGNEFDGKKIDEIVGKEIGEKILAHEYGEVSGSGLRVGGQGMAGFYDKILPAEMNRFFGKAAWGNARVGTTGIAAGGGKMSEYAGPPVTVGELRDELRDGGHPVAIESQMKMVINRMTLAGASWQDAVRLEGSPALARIFGGNMEWQRTPADVHAIDITPEMREKALGEGMPLFQVGGARRTAGRDIPLADVLEVFPGQTIAQDEGGIWITMKGGWKVYVHAVEHITVDQAKVDAYFGTKMPDGVYEANGAYVRGRSIIRLARNRGTNAWVLRHESVHLLEDRGVLRPDDVEALRAHIVKEVADGRWTPKNKQDVGGKEDRANWVRQELKNREAHKGALRRILDTIAEIIDTFVNLFKVTARGVVREIESGRVYERPAANTVAIERRGGQQQLFDEVEQREVQGSGFGVQGEEQAADYDMAATVDEILPPGVAERYKAAKIARPKLLDTIKEKAKLAAATFTPGRLFPKMPSRYFGRENVLLREFMESGDYAKSRAIMELKEILEPRSFGKGEYELFGLRLVLADLAKDMEEGGPLADWEAIVEDEGELPFGFKSKAEVEQALMRADAEVARSPKVAAALARRENVLRDLREQLVAAKMLPASVLTDGRYFHHQVLEYLNAKHAAGVGAADVRVKKAGWQRARQGSIKDYNTSYLQSEFEVLAQGFDRLNKKRILDEIGQAADIMGSLKDVARRRNYVAIVGGERNFARLVELRSRKAELQAEGGLDSEQKQQLKAINDEIRELDPTMPFREKIARGMSELSREFGDEGMDEESLDFREIADLAAEGSAPARMILKAIGDRNKFIKDTLGRDFATWRDVMRERAPREGSKGWAEWVPRPGSAWYMTNSINDQILGQVLAGERQLEETDVRKVLARGADVRWVVPAEVAEVLDGKDFQGNQKDNVVSALAEGTMNKWKQWILINPMRILKYNLNNMSGDLDIAFAYDPKIITRYAGKAMRDLWAYHYDKEMAPELKAELKEALRVGALGGISAHDIPNITKLHEFRMLEQAMGAGHGLALDLIERYWAGSKNFTSWRENVLRLAAYRYFKARVAAGHRVYGASLPSKVDAIPAGETERKAGLLARELVGDYGGLSQGGRWLRKKLIPFYSWSEINAPRYWRMFRNLAVEGEPKNKRLAAFGLVAGKKGAMLTAKAFMLYGAIHLWNALVWPDEEEELGEAGRRQLHIILGRRADGSIISLRLQGALSDALSWLGLEDFPEDARELASGKKSVGKFALEAAKAPVNKLVQGVRPDIKMPGELLTGRQLYPDVFNPRPIRDKGEHVARALSLESFYRQAVGRPMKGGSTAGQVWEDILGTFTYSADPGEQAYYKARDLARTYLEDKGIDQPAHDPTDRSNALFYYKQAIKFGDAAAAERYLARYKELGGNAKGLKISVQRAHPLASLPKRDLVKFMNRLDEEDRATVKRATRWYKETYKQRRAGA